MKENRDDGTAMMSGTLVRDAMGITDPGNLSTEKLTPINEITDDMFVLTDDKLPWIFGAPEEETIKEKRTSLITKIVFRRKFKQEQAQIVEEKKRKEEEQRRIKENAKLAVEVVLTKQRKIREEMSKHKSFGEDSLENNTRIVGNISIASVNRRPGKYFVNFRSTETINNQDRVVASSIFFDRQINENMIDEPSPIDLQGGRSFIIGTKEGKRSIIGDLADITNEASFQGIKASELLLKKGYTEFASTWIMDLGTHVAWLPKSK